MQFYTHEVQSTTYQHDEPCMLAISYTFYHTDDDVIHNVSMITINCNLKPLTSYLAYTCTVIQNDCMRIKLTVQTRGLSEAK